MRCLPAVAGNLPPQSRSALDQVRSAGPSRRRYTVHERKPTAPRRGIEGVVGADNGTEGLRGRARTSRGPVPADQVREARDRFAGVSFTADDVELCDCRYPVS
jgi:hypothetical protein